MEYDRSSGTTFVGCCLFLITFQCSSGFLYAQPNKEQASDKTSVADSEAASGHLQFAFESASWRSVLGWLAEEGDMALHVGGLPDGSFTYSDPNRYSPQQALDRVNMFLIPKGFSVVRSGKLLTVIDLNDSQSIQQLDAIARLVTQEELERAQDHDIVKFILPLESLDPTTVAGELVGLNLIVEPVILPESNQLIITDTARKLRSATHIVNKLLLDRPDQSQVKSLTLKHLSLPRFMKLARSHLGISADQLTSSEINISTDETDKRLFVTGTPDKIRLLENLIAVIDRPEQLLLAPDETWTTETVRPELSLKSHPVEKANLQTVYEVLQTVLVDSSLRLSMETETQSIVALASKDVHRRIEDTITELSREEQYDAEFSVVELNSLDPFFVISLIEEMYDDMNDPLVAGMKIDADPINARLFLRGSPEQIGEIERVVLTLDTKSNRKTRTVPVDGRHASRILKQAIDLWDGETLVKVMPSEAEILPQVSEQVVSDPAGISRPQEMPQASRAVELASAVGSAAASLGQVKTAEFTSQPSSTSGSFIRTRITNQGIVLEGDDPQSLDELETHIRQIAARGMAKSKVQTIVYYLKFTKADDAVKMLGDLLDGTASLIDEEQLPALVNASVPLPTSSRDLNSNTQSADGAVIVSAGSLTAISDSRLNRLICLGTPEDLQLVERYLQVIDKDDSLTEIETHGASAVIDLQFTRAEEVAEVVRDAYVGRIALNNAERRQQAMAAKDNKSGNLNLQTSTSGEPKITLAVHAQTNSLVVTTTKPLLAEITELINNIDRRGEKAVEVISYPSGTFLQDVLKKTVIGETAKEPQ